MNPSQEYRSITQGRIIMQRGYAYTMTFGWLIVVRTVGRGQTSTGLISYRSKNSPVRSGNRVMYCELLKPTFLKVYIRALCLMSMVELNHNVVSFNSDTLIKGDHGVVVAVFCTKKGSSGAKCVLKNGTTTSGTTEFSIFGEIEGNYQDVNRRFEAGIFADITGSAEWTVVFK
jgi:hypothetical protein